MWWRDWQITLANSAKQAETFNIEGGVNFAFQVDPRPRKLDPSILKEIWKPDLFIGKWNR
jgi:hypothetical protein